MQNKNLRSQSEIPPHAPPNTQQGYRAESSPHFGLGADVRGTACELGGRDILRAKKVAYKKYLCIYIRNCFITEPGSVQVLTTCEIFLDYC